MKDAFSSVVTIATGIIGVAFLAALVSRNSQTPAVIQTAGGALAQDLGAALSPITGGSGALNNGGAGYYPTTSFPAG